MPRLSAMLRAQIESDAFHQEALKSERLRCQVLIAAILVLYGTAVLRVALTPEPDSWAVLFVFAPLVLTFCVYELISVGLITRRLRMGREPPAVMWVGNVVIELLLPTTGIVLMVHYGQIGPYQALSAPSLLGYMFFTLLSVLRISPWLSLLTGVLAAAFYAATVAYTFQAFPDQRAAAFPLGIYATYASFFVVTGAAAAFVAARVSGHVSAAMREQATEAELNRVQADLDVARSIQQGLLPQTPPDLPGLDIAGWSQPADETGGDYFDWQPLPNGHLVVSLADVTGHGIGPALVTAACRAYARASFLSDLTLAQRIEQINQLLYDDLNNDRFVTFASAVVDPAGAEVAVLSAGHGPLLYYHAARDTFELFAADNLPLGIMAPVGYGAPRVLRLAPGDFLALVTDGFFEWANPANEPFGVQRLEAALRAARQLSAAQMARRAYAALRVFVGEAPQADDVTAVIIKRNAPAAAS